MTRVRSATRVPARCAHWNGGLRNAFAERDLNHDGVMTREEEKAWHKANDAERKAEKGQ